MFWKRKGNQQDSAEMQQNKVKPKKEKKITPLDIMSNDIEQLGPGEYRVYRLLGASGLGLAVIELNPEYPVKGKKYSIKTERLVDDRPSGRRTKMWDSDKPRDIAKWIIEKRGEPFASTSETVAA